MSWILRPAFVVLLLAVLWPAHAASAQESGKAALESPEQIARETVQTLLDEMEGRREELRDDPAKLDALIRRVLVPLVDVGYMSRLVLGPYWREASESQRRRFENAFQKMLIQTYGDALIGFRKEQIEFLPIRAGESADDVTFHAVVHTESGENVQVDFNLHLVNGRWRIYNGSVGNLTFVTNYRAQFNQEIRRSDLETLIGKLESRYGASGGG